MYRKIFVVVICIAMILSFFSCASKSENESDIKVLIVIDKDMVDVAYYCDEVIDAVSEKCKEYNLNYEVLYLSIDDNSELTKKLSSDYGLVIMTSPSLEATTVIEAKTHPYTNFILLGAIADMGLDDIQDVQNVYSITLKGNEMSFLAGVYAASNIEIGKKICIIGINEYMDNIEYEVGFRCGVKCINSNINVSYYYTQTDDISIEMKDKIVGFIGNNCGYVYFIEQNDELYDIVNELDIPIIEHKYNRYENTYCIKENLIDPLKNAIDELYNGTFKGKILKFGVGENAYCEVLNDETIITEVVTEWENRISEELIVIPKTRSGLSSFSVPSL